jgi:hypothetical protein
MWALRAEDQAEQERRESVMVNAVDGCGYCQCHRNALPSHRRLFEDFSDNGREHHFAFFARFFCSRSTLARSRSFWITDSRRRLRHCPHHTAARRKQLPVKPRATVQHSAAGRPLQCCRAIERYSQMQPGINACSTSSRAIFSSPQVPPSRGTPARQRMAQGCHPPHIPACQIRQ